MLDLPGYPSPASYPRPLRLRVGFTQFLFTLAPPSQANKGHLAACLDRHQAHVERCQSVDFFDSGLQHVFVEGTEGWILAVLNTQHVPEILERVVLVDFS